MSVLAFAAPVMAEAAIDEGPTQVSEIVVTAERREAPWRPRPCR
ncbi:hypothetical protein [Brevundimonas diminuta]